jgi:hypothetical protein
MVERPLALEPMDTVRVAAVAVEALHYQTTFHMQGRLIYLLLAEVVEVELLEVTVVGVQAVVEVD